MRGTWSYGSLNPCAEHSDSPVTNLCLNIIVLLKHAADFIWQQSLVQTVSCVSQQHGSVYWRRGASETLSQLDPDQDLFRQLQVCMFVNGGVPSDSDTSGPAHVFVLTGQLLRVGLSCVDGLQQQSPVSGPAGSSRRSPAPGRDHRVQSLRGLSPCLCVPLSRSIVIMIINKFNFCLFK